jgi:hypothetical protein
MRNACNIYSENPKGRYHIEDAYVDGKMGYEGVY